MTTPLIDPAKKIEIPDHRSFKTITEAHEWAESLIRSGIGVQQSHLRNRFFKHVLRGDRMFAVLGMSRSAAKKAVEIEPNGEWRVEVERPGAYYETVGLLDNHPHHTSGYRFSTWYSRFLPYAVAMLKCEDGFEYRGVDFDSINSHYTSVLGFVDLGQGDGYVPAKNGEPEYWRIVKEDCELFEDCYEHTCRVAPPGLPFDEAHWSCMTYVACFQPWLLIEMVGRDHWWIEQVKRCFESMGRPAPNWSARPAKQRRVA